MPVTGASSSGQANEYVWNQLGRSLGDLGQGLQWLFPGAKAALTGQAPKSSWATAVSPTAPRPRIGTIPSGSVAVENPNAQIASRPIGNTPIRSTRSVTLGAQTAVPITSPNTITQAADDEYRQQLAQYNNQAAQARTALIGFQPGSGSMPEAATQALQTGRDIWAQKYKDTLARPGGMTGTFNPLMQARGDVPSMSDLWSGMKSIQAPTAGPGRTSEDVTDEAMAKAKAEGRYFAPPETGGFANTLDPNTQQRMQQYATAFQAQKGTEDASAAQRSQDFINKFKLGSLNPGSYNFPGYDAAAMMTAPSKLF